MCIQVEKSKLQTNKISNSNKNDNTNNNNNENNELNFCMCDEKFGGDWKKIVKTVKCSIYILIAQSDLCNAKCRLEIFITALN